MNQFKVPKGQILCVEYVKEIKNKVVVLARVTENTTTGLFNLYIENNEGAWEKVSSKKYPDFDEEVSALYVQAK